MDFGLLPPEINSGRMYTGPGPGPMLAAATAWDGLAVELHATAAGYASELSALTGAWSGPSSTSMASAAAPYVAWMSATAVHAGRGGAQARLAIAAYEAAFAATVPPPVIAANRAQLMVLIATNIFGQNTPAIMMTEAQYMEMWAQDAAAMYGYAGSSATASRMTAFTEPPQTTNHGQLGAQSSAVAQTAATAAGGNLQSAFPQLLSAVPRALQGLALPTASQSASATPQWVTDLGNLSTFLGGAVTGPYTFPGVLPPSGVPYLLGIQSVLVTQNGQGVSALLGKIGGKPITGALAPLAEFALHTPILGSEGLGGGSVSAGIGRAGLSESYRCLRAGRWPPRRSHRRRRRCRRRAWPPRRLRPPTARVRCSVAWRCRAWLAALPPVLPATPSAAPQHPPSVPLPLPSRTWPPKPTSS
ncbi:PPE family protein [Mycobacterium tuberculosis]|nr:PPE family protein [Mycobacterium tuberculosis]